MQYRVVRTIDPPAEADGSSTSTSADGASSGIPLLPTKETIRNYSDNPTFDLPINQHGELQIYGNYKGNVLELKIRY